MHGTDRNKVSERKPATDDPLAEIIRAAGPRPSPPQEHYDQVYAAAHATWQRQLHAKRRNWYALAAAIGAIAFGGLLWFALPDSEPNISAEIAIARGTLEQNTGDGWVVIDGGIVELRDGTRIRTASDGAASLRLADGGSLRLADNTDVVLSGSEFSLNTGMLYFDSADRRQDLSIDVVTAFGTVRDIGTQFEVRTSADALRVRVRSGSVSLLDTTAAEPIAGRAGEELRLNAAGQLSRSEITRDDPQWAWAEALAVAPEFETPTVLRYLTWIAEETGKSLDFESETVRLQAELARFVGDPRGLRPTQLLVTITATSDFNCEITEQGRIFVSRDTLQE